MLTFATNTKDAIITSLLSEIACWSRRIISQWLNTVGKPDSKNSTHNNTSRLVLLTGGGSEALYQLFSKGTGGVLESKSMSSNEDVLLKEYAVSHAKHLIHYGMAAAIMKQHVTKLCNSQEYRDKIMEENQSLIDQRVAKEHKNKIIRGSIANLTFSTTNRNEHDLLSITIKYDSGEEEKVDMQRLQTLLKNYRNHGEKELQTKKNTPNKRKAPEASSTPKKKKEKKPPTPKKVPVVFNHPDDLKGKRVAKFFGTDVFFGTIKGHEKDEGVIYWQIEYDDGDAEDYELKDIEEGSALYAKKKLQDTKPMETDNVADTEPMETVKNDPEPVEEQKKAATTASPEKTADNFFCKEIREKVKEENPDASFGELSKLVGEKYKSLSEEELKVWQAKASK